MATWQLEVLGKGCFRSESHTLIPERKTAGLLVYLALEGPTSRSKLAGLFWPEAPERTARNNLAALTQRVKKLTGTPLLTGADTLGVTNALEVDAAKLKVASLTGEHPAIIQGFGSLLATYDYDDLPEFDEWLLAERERLGRLYEEALAAEIARHEKGSAYREAIPYAERLLAFNPASEETYRQLMRLHYLAGDRPAAFSAYARLKEVLRRDFGVEPLPETVALAQEIEREALTPAVKPQRPTLRIPLQVLRPPLVGRAREWAQLEEAWERGKAVFLSGPPGVGKTRLALDFAASKGSYQLFEARPGDADVPFAYQTRVWRQCLATHPDIALPPWVRRELSRLLPELAETPPPPLRSEEDRLRLFEAMAALMWLATGSGIATVVVNDIHYADAASAEASRYLAEQYVPSEGVKVTPTITTFRTSELGEAQLEGIEAMQAQGYALHLELSPLEHPDIASLVAGLKLPEVTPESAPCLTDYLYRYTGGNPLFVVETLKSLLEEGTLGDPTCSPPASSRVMGLLKGRLARLSAPAQRLAWTAAVAGSDFGPELAEHVLETNSFDLAEPWGELEAAGVLGGARFSHDLLAETALGSVPTPVKALLHRRCAAHLETRGESPARIAQHYLGASDEARAAPWLTKAAEAAKAALRLTDAADFYEQAADIEARLERPEHAFALYLKVAYLLRHFDTGARHEPLLAKLFGSARTTKQQAQTWHVRSEYLNKVGRRSEAEAAARRGHDFARQTADSMLEATLLGDLATAIWLQGRLHEACDIHRDILAITEVHGSEADLAADLANLGVMLDHLDAHREALEHHRRAARLLENLGDRASQVAVLNNLSVSQLELGLVHASVTTLKRSLDLCEGIEGADHHQFFALMLLGACHTDLADYGQAHARFERAQAYAPEASSSYAARVFLRYQANLLFQLGAFEAADEKLEASLAHDDLPSQHRGAAWTLRAKLLAAQGKPSAEALREAERQLSFGERRLTKGDLWLTKAQSLPPSEGLRLAQQALKLATTYDLNGLRFGAEARCAQALLALGAPDQARRHTAALDLLGAYHPADFYMGEILLTHYRVLDALGDERAPEQLERCLEWVMNVADTKTPPEYRGSFLERSPTNRVILEAARAGGLL